MQTKLITMVLITATIAASCGNKKGGLEEKKAELSKLKTEYQTLGDKIKVLEKEVAKLDTASKLSKKRLVALSTIAPVTFNHFIDVQGKVDAEENVTVSPQAGGAITRILVDVGASVTKGQVLAEVDNSVMVQSLAEIEQGLSTAQTLYDKQKRLWEQNIGTEIQYITAKNNYESALKRKNTMLEQINMTRIKSPINGVIDENMLKLGQIVAPGMPCFRVVNGTKLKVKADVAENYASKIKQGEKISIFLPDLNKEIDGVISYSSKVINTLNRTFTVEAKLTGNQPDLRPNMIATIKVSDYTAEKAIAVPSNTINNSDEGSFVYIAVEKNGKMTAKKVAVTTGLSYNNLTEIKTGLSAGEKIIIAGYQELNDGETLTLE